jgi:hypothetical protein
MKVEFDEILLVLANWTKTEVSTDGIRTLKDASTGMLARSWLNIIHFLAEFEYQTPIGWSL